MDDETLLKTMLFDFFGDLLTEKQQEYFDLYHNEDLSLSEIAERAGISRQGVYDIITRAEKTLMEIELKTGLIQKWQETRTQLGEIETIARELRKSIENNRQAAELADKLNLIVESMINDQV